MIMLNMYPIIIMLIPTIVKNTIISFVFITLFRITASGRDSAAEAIINASAVPSGIPFSNKTTAIGTIAAQFA